MHWCKRHSPHIITTHHQLYWHLLLLKAWADKNAPASIHQRTSGPLSSCVVHCLCTYLSLHRIALTCTHAFTCEGCNSEQSQKGCAGTTKVKKAPKPPERIFEHKKVKKGALERQKGCAGTTKVKKAPKPPERIFEHAVHNVSVAV